MKWRDVVLCSVALLLHPGGSSAEITQPILDQIKPGTITIIGEVHRRKESVQMFEGLITDYLRQKKCLTVALEIDSAEQPVIDRILQGKPATEMKIAPMIDHQPLHNMIDDLSSLKRAGACLKIAMIDTGIETEYDRDKWMAKQLVQQRNDTPILVLLGNLHTLKKVNWNLTVADPLPFVAEILNSQGYRVRSYPQIWLENGCTDKSSNTSHYVSADTQEALALLNNSLIALINALPAKTAKGVVDGFVVWEQKKCISIDNQS